ncbi:hypothetical protein BLA29_005279 [Euroglyphus maynei]|uniref:Uncharacterized protein n=1 Tax=Euroglyphus maynei TaxID=6958 RepID=A0A1Y3BJ46_EURMA|nr:hypothetical protein BLA29_005279 [Euroglyphus maynei]
MIQQNGRIYFSIAIIIAIYNGDDVNVDGDDSSTNTTNNNDDDDNDFKYWFRLRGIISADIDITETDINQCDDDDTKTTIANNNNELRTTLNLFGTHKCHNENSEVIFFIKTTNLSKQQTQFEPKFFSFFIFSPISGEKQHCHYE